MSDSREKFMGGFTRTHFLFAIALALAIGVGAMTFKGQQGGQAVVAAPGGGGGGNSPPDFGDLIIVLRNDSGVPELDANNCWQPIAFESEYCPEAVWNCGDAPCLVPTDPETCGVLQPTCTKEVDFGRINEARSPDTVFATQLEDVIVRLATADCTSLDPAGRLVATTDGITALVDDKMLRQVDHLDGIPAEASVSATIDSPLQNLAIYREMMLKGSIGVDLPGGADPLTSAARALGAASDKAGLINVDLVAYLNQIMELTDNSTPTALPKICIEMKEEVMGVVQLVEKCFLDYGAYTQYDRAANFGGLPDPAYIPQESPAAGWFEYLEFLGSDTFTITRGPITTAVFGDNGFTGGNIGGFARAADDARAVINFMHSWAVPAEFETPIPPCGTTGEGAYDVSISDVSGLQVPKVIVDGSEGREFSVTVANAGPDEAEITIRVTATPRNGGVIVGSPWTFPAAPPVVLGPGESASYTQFFAVDLGEATTIDWRATAIASKDVNPANNTVEAVSSVETTGSASSSGTPVLSGRSTSGGNSSASGSGGNAGGGDNQGGGSKSGRQMDNLRP